MCLRSVCVGAERAEPLAVMCAHLYPSRKYALVFFFLERHGSPRPPGRLAVVIKFDMKGG